VALGVKYTMAKLEEWVRDDPTSYHPPHQQRGDYFENQASK